MNPFPLNLLTFPLWWYTIGAKLVLGRLKQEYRYGLQKNGLAIFTRHISEPLYGDYTRSGRFLSFFLRIILLLYKLLIFFIRLLVACLLVIIYLLLLPFIVTMIIFQLLPAK